MPRMKNVNLFVDVDLTLVDERGVMIDGADEAMRILHDAGCHLFLWSTGGREYCETVAKRLGVADLFEAFLPKPDAFVDDMPSTIVGGPLFSIADETSWPDLARPIAREHVHPSERRRPA